jgi:predicted nucleic acid-binding protein
VSPIYLDSSALVKLVVREPESAALADLLRDNPERVSSALSLTEVPRALRRAGFGRVEVSRARQVVEAVALIAVDRRVLAVAAALEPPTLRTLDAIHLATAVSLEDDLTALVTYDRRLSEAARRAHVRIVAPA